MIKRLIPILLSTLAFLLGWDLLTRFGNIPNFILPSPPSVWTRFLRALQDGSLPYHTGITLLEIVLGLLVGVIFATVVGYALARSRSLERVLSPYLVASQAIPVVAIAPLLVIWLGDGILAKAIICALIVFYPVLVNTIVGVRAWPTRFVDRPLRSVIYTHFAAEDQKAGKIRCGDLSCFIQGIDTVVLSGTVKEFQKITGGLLLSVHKDYDQWCHRHCSPGRKKAGL